MVGLTRKLNEIYEESKMNPENRHELFYDPKEIYKQNTLEFLVEKLNKTKITLDSINMDELDSYKFKSDLADVISNIKKENLSDYFGDELFLWTWTNISMSYRRKIYSSHIKTIIQKYGLDDESLEKSIDLRLEKNCISNTQSILNTAMLIMFLNKNIQNIDLANNIEKYIHKRYKKEKENIIKNTRIEIANTQFSGTGYEEMWGGRVNVIKDIEYSMFLDAPVGIMLMYENEPFAVTTFFMTYNKHTGIDGALTIAQIQGITPSILSERYKTIAGERPNKKHTPKIIDYIRWDDLLLDMSNEIAKKFNTKYISIRSGLNHPYYGIKNGILHMPHDVAIRRYDSFAERNMFTQSEDGNWYKKIF
jgi:hypothetical protein